MKVARRVCALIAVLLLAGCSTPYMTDRRRDALDVFTLIVGEGAGAKARVGPISAGLLLQTDIAGLRGGGIVDSATEGFKQLNKMEGTLTVAGFEVFSDDKSRANRRGKWISSTTWAGINCFPLNASDSPKRPIRAAIPQFTQIEAVVALGFSLRVGFNPGELIDFILGWTSVDIFSDDIESREQLDAAIKKPPAREPEKSDSQP